MDFIKYLILLVFASFASAGVINTNTVIPGVNIQSPDEGARYQAGEFITITFCPDPSIKNVSMLLYSDTVGTVQTLATNVKLAPPGKSSYTFRYQLFKNITASPGYRVYIFPGYQSFGSSIYASSASFTIGNPKYGIAITSPEAGQQYYCGGNITVRWNDPYKAYTGLNFLIVIFYQDGASPIDFSPPVRSVPVGQYTKTVTIPTTNIANSRGYNVAVYVKRPSDTAYEIYFSDTFTICGCKAPA